MEVKRALSVGNFTGAPSGLGSVLELDAGQLFVGESMILKSQDSTPSDGIAGQLIYVNNTTNNERMLKFHNGTAWVNVTSGCSCPVCGSNNTQSLGSKPTADLCASGVASSVLPATGPGPWRWNCTDTGGGTVAFCSANYVPPAINGACGSDNQKTFATTDSPNCPSAHLCDQGTAINYGGCTILPWSWGCRGENGGYNATCAAYPKLTGSITISCCSCSNTTPGLCPCYYSGGHFICSPACSSGTVYDVGCYPNPSGVAFYGYICDYKCRQ